MLNFDKCPERERGALERYLLQRIPTGDYLRAVLSNDLREAHARGDEQSIQDMHSVVVFLYNEAPGDAWGSPERVKAWLRG